MGKTVPLPGAAGFIGFHLGERLLDGYDGRLVEGSWPPVQGPRLAQGRAVRGHTTRRGCGDSPTTSSLRSPLTR